LGKVELNIIKLQNSLTIDINFILFMRLKSSLHYNEKIN